MFMSKDLLMMAFFLKVNGYITYTFQHLSQIFVFDEMGNFVKEVHTKDNVPYPSIIRYKQYYIYERGKTFNSNVASFADGEFLYVLSYRIPRREKQFVLDTYNLGTGKYQYSVCVSNGDKYSNIDIEDVFSENNAIYIDVGEELFCLRW